MALQFARAGTDGLENPEVFKTPELRKAGGLAAIRLGGDPDKLGRGTLWRDELPECLHQNHIFRVRLARDQIIPEFASFQIGSPYGKSYFLAHSKQTPGIATINQRVLGDFPMKVPSLVEQRRLVSRLDARCSAARRVIAAADAQKQAAQALLPAILREAFGNRE